MANNPCIPGRPEAGDRSATSVYAEPVRGFSLGSEWLYIKLCCTTTSADDLLAGPILDLTRMAIAGGIIDSWFFVRYFDDSHQLRLRFQGQRGTLRDQFLPLLTDLADTLQSRGLAAQIHLDPYVPEVRRYGGPEGLRLAEAMFHEDSSAGAECLAAIAEHDNPPAKWHIAALALQLSLDTYTPNSNQQRALLKRLAEAYANEFGGGVDLQKALAAVFRRFRQELNATLAPPMGCRPSPDWFLPYARRADRMRGIARGLADLYRQDQLSVDPATVWISLIHMQMNRIFPQAARQHELVLYDLCYRHWRSVELRAAATGGGSQ